MQVGQFKGRPSMLSKLSTSILEQTANDAMGMVSNGVSQVRASLLPRRFCLVIAATIPRIRRGPATSLLQMCSKELGVGLRVCNACLPVRLVVSVRFTRGSAASHDDDHETPRLMSAAVVTRTIPTLAHHAQQQQQLTAPPFPCHSHPRVEVKE